MFSVQSGHEYGQGFRVGRRDEGGDGWQLQCVPGSISSEWRRGGEGGATIRRVFIFADTASLRTGVKHPTGGGKTCIPMGEFPPGNRIQVGYPPIARRTGCVKILLAAFINVNG